MKKIDTPMITENEADLNERQMERPRQATFPTSQNGVCFR
jgi:hypothetical protein